MQQYNTLLGMVFSIHAPFLAVFRATNNAGQGPQICVEGRECIVSHVYAIIFSFLYSYPHPSTKFDNPTITNNTAD